MATVDPARDERRALGDLSHRQGVGSQATDPGIPMLPPDPDLMVRPPKDDWCHLSADQLDRLDHASIIVGRAFDSTPYLVGSCLAHAHWRDVDVRVVLDDDEFALLFRCGATAMRTDPMWSLLCASISEYLARLTDLPIDFQVQQRTYANQRFSGQRHPLGLYLSRREDTDEPV